MLLLLNVYLQNVDQWDFFKQGMIAVIEYQLQLNC